MLIKNKNIRETYFPESNFNLDIKEGMQFVQL